MRRIIVDTDTGKKYIQIGNKAVEISGFDAAGKPTIKGVWSEEKPNDEGGMDCTVHVPCMQIATGKPRLRV